MTMRKIRYITAAAGVALLTLAAVSILVLAYQARKVTNHAETTLAAYRLVLEVLADYLKENGGKWPRSWDDMSQIRHSGYAGLRWPEDLAKVRGRIRINFELTTDEVISKDYDHFTAVEQIGPNFGPYEWLIAKFLYDARRSVGRVPDSRIRRDGSP